MERTDIGYTIPHTSLRAEIVRDGRRIKFIIDGKELAVEAAAKLYLRERGWWVVAGAKISFLLSILSANFRNSFVFDVLENYVGADVSMLAQQIEGHCEETLNARRIGKEHLEAAVSFMCRYYRSESDHKKARLWGRKLSELTPAHQIALVSLYREIGYFTKGIPDLFATKDGEFVFFEVKSEGDALRAEQYIFAEAILSRMANSFHVLRVLGLEGGKYHSLANPSDKNRRM